MSNLRKIFTTVLVLSISMLIFNTAAWGMTNANSDLSIVRFSLWMEGVKITTNKIHNDYSISNKKLIELPIELILPLQKEFNQIK